MPQRDYTFVTEVWLYSGEAAWHFVTLPLEVAEDIRFYFAHEQRGWGSYRVKVKIGECTWQTSIFPDKASGSFFLPLKAEVRKKIGLKAGDRCTVKLELGNA